MAIKTDAPIDGVRSDVCATRALRRSRLTCAGLATITVAALAPTLALAQATGEKPLTIGVRGTASYDSNPARGSAQAAAIRDVEQDEVIYAPSLTVDYLRNTGRRSLFFNGAFGYDFHSKNTQLNRENIRFAGGATKSVGALCGVNARADFSRAQSGLQYQDLNVTKNAAQTYRVSVGENCATPTGFTQGVQVFYGATNNSSAEMNDFSNIGVSGTLGYSNDTLGTVGLVLSYNHTDYNHTPAAAAAAESDGLGVASVGVQFTRPIGARLSGSAAVFYSHTSRKGGSDVLLADDGSFDGVTASAGLTYIVGPRLNLAANVSRDVTGSSRQDASYTVSTRTDLTANYTVSSRISANLGGSWWRDSYRGRDLTLPQTGPGRLDVSAVFGGVSMQLGRRSAISADVRHERGRADLDLFDYTSNRASLTISAAF